MRIFIALFFAVSSNFLAGVPAFATPVFTVTAPTTFQYDPSLAGFSVPAISINNAPQYIQVGLTLTDTAGNQVNANDDYRISTGNQCSFDSSWTNTDTGGVITVSGDDSTNVIISGASADIPAILDHVWIYRKDSAFCDRGSGHTFGQNLLLRSLKVSAIETQPGVMWSPSTHHYYQLVTQTTDDGMGQPTDPAGNVTDSSRYFVKWSTARSEAKAATLTIGGQVHQGYLAAITTKDEFSFLNDNVTGGSGTLYPAWVGGSDAGTEGTWNWVDGPEAAQFGGDSLTHNVDQSTAPDGRVLQQDSDGDYYINYPTDGYDYFSYEDSVLLMRDSNGDYVYDAETGFKVAVNEGNYCTDYFNDPFAALSAMDTDGPQNVVTQYGSTVICNVTWNGYWPLLSVQLRDDGGNVYDYTQAIYKWGDWGSPLEDSNYNYLAVEVGTSDFSYYSGTENNYDGAKFWGNDWGGGPGSGSPNYCHQRGVRGVCSQTQTDTNGTDRTNNYYVYWSNGGDNITGNWDGTGVKHGDGAYSPQPDNASNEDALIINWCERNSGDTHASGPTETLYGNSGYHCTPGWNDLPADNWATAHNTYFGLQDDTPNQIGTTDYVVEFCGYSNEAGCNVNADAVTTTDFILPASSCPESGTPQPTVTYSAATVDATDLSSTTMATETFSTVPTGTLTPQTTNVGYMEGDGTIFQANMFGGAGGSGNFITSSDVMLTLPKTECYIGFWWSAGNADNHVQLLDSSNNVLATFDASDLVTALGACPSAYCGNPNQSYADGTELFAYVHMRLPTGFQKVRFYGTGFEMDNISISVDVPDRASNETNLTGPVTMNLAVPEVIPVDPQSNWVAVPELQFSGNPTGALCFAQAADSEGVLEPSPWLTFSTPENDPVTATTTGLYFVIGGAVSDVKTSSGHIELRRSDNSHLLVGSSSYVVVYSVSDQSPTESACAAGTRKIIELRPLQKELTQIAGIQLTNRN